MTQNLLRALLMVLCGFCHAPRDAYEELLEHDEINRNGLCDDAQERLRMAAVDEPPEEYGLTWAWNAVRHEWVIWREYGPCATCGRLTWRYGNETCAHECAACQRAVLDEAARVLGPLSKDEAKRILEGHPRQTEPPAPHRHLLFSDYSVPNTRLFEALPGPRYGLHRPRILFGQAVRPVRWNERDDAEA